VNRHVKILMECLASKGVEVTLIPDLIKHVALIIADHPSVTLHELNRRLKTLGFNGFELDVKSLYLIILAFEPDLAYRLPDKRSTSKDRPLLSNNKKGKERSEGSDGHA
jgi:hypothetical protein